MLNLTNGFYQSISDTDKQRYFRSLWDPNYQQFLKSSLKLLDVWLKWILAYNICKLTSLEYFEIKSVLE